MAATTCSCVAGVLSCSTKTSPVLVTLMNAGSAPCPVTACFALGSSTLFPRWSMGVITMKMIRSTSTTSTSGVMLMSERTPLLVASNPMALRLCCRGGRGGGLACARARQGLVESPFLEEEVDQLVAGVGDVDAHLFD